ncbi:MAG: response regulator, partial [Hyphomicrobium sp.]
MLREELIFVGTCDIAGLVRGKGFPASELPARRKTGIGWTHTNLMQTCFGQIFDTPFGTGGDLMIVPDPSAEVHVDFRDDSAAEHFFLGDICHTDGSPWECCARAFLRRASTSLIEVSGLNLIAAFEQEFVYTRVEDLPGHAYSLSAFRRQGILGEMLTAAIRATSAKPDSFLAEYGPRQYEVTIAPDGQTALELALANPPDLALLDIQMPRLDGVALCRTLKSTPDTRFMPVIIVTAFDSDEEKIKAIDAGADDFITKPYNSIILLTRVRSLLKIKKLNDEIEARNTLLRKVLNRYVAEDVAEIILEDPDQQLQLGGETRMVTVIFADICGFTNYTERHPAPQVIDTLNKIFKPLSNVVFAYRGTFDKYT